MGTVICLLKPGNNLLQCPLVYRNPLFDYLCFNFPGRLLVRDGNCSGLRGAEWLMAEYEGWVTLGDESPKPPEKSGSWLKPIYFIKSELLPEMLPTPPRAHSTKPLYRVTTSSRKSTTMKPARLAEGRQSLSPANSATTSKVPGWSAAQAVRLLPAAAVSRCTGWTKHPTAAAIVRPSAGKPVSSSSANSAPTCSPAPHISGRSSAGLDKTRTS